jgi:hypothetical protein
MSELVLQGVRLEDVDTPEGRAVLEENERKIRAAWIAIHGPEDVPVKVVFYAEDFEVKPWTHSA